MYIASVFRVITWRRTETGALDYYCSVQRSHVYKGPYPLMTIVSVKENSQNKTRKPSVFDRFVKMLIDML